MLLSILIPGKNDNFREGSSKVLEFNLKKTLDNINNFDTNDIELVLCDWGSNNKIVQSFDLKTSAYFKCVYVHPDIAKKYNGAANYSIVHPVNTAFRHSIGKYVIFWDSDAYITTATFNALYQFVKNMEASNDMSFYWGSRYNVPFSTYNQFTEYEELDYFLSHNIITSHDKISVNHFSGTGISLLMNRELWQNSTGWYEKLIYWGWQDTEFHHRLMTKYRFGGDLEDHNMKFYHLIEKPNNKISNKIENPWDRPYKFEANDASWGLFNEKIEII